MRVLYTAPNRAPHYAIAAELERGGILGRFVCGFSRFSPRAGCGDLGRRLIRADHVQNLYLASLKCGAPRFLTEELAYASKLWLDAVSGRTIADIDAFIFYNGTGLSTARALRGTRTLRIVEVVNSHVKTQESLLREEHKMLNLPFRPFHRRETCRRLSEYEEADYILGPSLFSKRSFVAQGIPPERFIYSPYGFDLLRPSESSVKDSSTFRVLYVGQISIRKGLRYLLEAFQKLQHPRKELWIVGPKAAGATGLEGVRVPAGVRFLGVLKGDALNHAYKSANAFVLPSIEDGFGLVLGEALVAGLPIIATTNTGAPDLYEDGTSGWIVPIRNPEAIKDKLQALIDEPSLAAEMSSRAQDRSLALGGWDTIGSNLVRVLKELAGSVQKV